MSFLLDTNHCSYIINQHPQVIDALNNHADQSISINIITYAQLIYMTEKSTKKVENRLEVERFFYNVDLYFLDEETAIIYSNIKAKLFNHFAPKDKNKRRRTNLINLGFTDHDLWIVATTIQHQLTLVSADSDFLRIQQIIPFSLESWLF
jgi:tRNA(fMet)-specific endonuclease VapC